MVKNLLYDKIHNKTCYFTSLIVIFVLCELYSELASKKLDSTQ